ncbi:MAG: DUF1622 domain-containing protein [Erysipelothrix sp.]|nr:DUF1622 domain-containing protein [Erysipelothrix sp.]
MADLLNNTHHLIGDIALFLAYLIEIWGIFLIVLTVSKEIFRTVVDYRFDFNRISHDETINHGLASALEVLLAAEILKTLTISNNTQLLIIGALVFIRIFIGLILHWELNQKTQQLHVEEKIHQFEKEKRNRD